VAEECFLFMTTAEMIRHASPTEVKLQKMGKFWVGYEQSAFLLSQIKQLKPSKRFVKAVGQDVVSVGFPGEVLQKLTSLQVVEQTGNFVILQSEIVFNQANFNEWKARIPLKNLEEKQSMVLGVEALHATPPHTVPQPSSPSKPANLYENLPVFKAAYELLRFVYRESANMTRTYRFTFGENLQKSMSELMLNVYRANCNYDKQAPIARARENAEMVRLMLRVAFDERQITVKQSIFANEQIESISKQLTAWGKYSAL
jgi:hypothetical protein